MSKKLEDPVKLITKQDYVEAISALKDKATTLRIQVLDLASNYDCVVSKLQQLESEKYEKFDKKTTKKTKKAVKKARSKS